MQTLNITHAHYRGKIMMIQAGSELEFYDNKGVLIDILYKWQEVSE